MPTMVDALTLTSMQYKNHARKPLMHEGTMPCATRCQKPAPTASRLSRQSTEISSMVSVNALTIKAKLVIKSAAKPTPVPMPSEENSINAHTSAGILRKKVAKPRTNLAHLGNGDTSSLAKSAVKNASIPAIVVEEIAMAMVTPTLSRILYILISVGNCGGKKSSERKIQNWSRLANTATGENSVKKLHTAYSAAITTKKMLYILFSAGGITDMLFFTFCPSN